MSQGKFFLFLSLVQAELRSCAAPFAMPSSSSATSSTSSASELSYSERCEQKEKLIALLKKEASSGLPMVAYEISNCHWCCRWSTSWKKAWCWRLSTKTAPPSPRSAPSWTRALHSVSTESPFSFFGSSHKANSILASKSFAVSFRAATWFEAICQPSWRVTHSTLLKADRAMQTKML